MSYSAANLTKAAFPMFDMMLQMQQIGLRAMTLYQPAMKAFTSPLPGSQRPSGLGASQSRMTDVTETQQETVIPIGEEVLNVGTRMVQGKTTRVRRVVVETPVQQDVTLHTETVVVEHRKPVGLTNEGILTEVTVEMSDANEVPMVSKSVRLVEEVLLRKEVTARVETIRDTVKRDRLEFDQPTTMPVVFDAVKADAQKQDAKRRDEANEKKTSLAVDNKSVDNKPVDHKRG